MVLHHSPALLIHPFSAIPIHSTTVVGRKQGVVEFPFSLGDQMGNQQDDNRRQCCRCLIEEDVVKPQPFGNFTLYLCPACVDQIKRIVAADTASTIDTGE
jgi:hypothetical protein